jgi:SagB-type dehydrogenase family enzyme
VLVSDIDTFELSPFAWLRTHEGACVLETALLPVRAVLNDPEIAAIICYFAKPKSLELVAVGRQECNKRILEAVVQLLVEEGFILRFNSGKSVNGELQDVNPQPIALSQWDFHDLLFHSRSRIGRTNARFGATFRFKNSENKPLPAVKRTMSVNRIQLFVPNLEALLRCDFPGTYILEARRSQRCNSARPITALELGEFLFRSARVRSVYEIDGMELSNRPYPCGGASYELEIYPLIRRCQGLPSGVYHYDPLSHVLESISEPNSDSDRLISDASISSGSLVIPDVLLVVTARFRRVSYKYESIAYATILKDVGCLYQTMYLVATSMQLASCALGSGDSDRFSKILNINYCEESSVGEFMLGDMR